MEKEQILSTLTEKLGQTSFSQRSLSDYVENNLPTDGAEADDAYFEKHVKVLKSFGGQFSADVASAINSQMDGKVKEYLKKHPELLKTVAEPQPNNDGNEDDKRMKALEDKIEALIKERDEAKNLQNVLNLVNGVKGKATELKVTRKALWEDAADKVKYAEGDTEDAFLAKVKEQYAKDLKRYYGDGEKPYQGEKNPGGGDGGNKVVNDYFAKKKAKMGKK